MQSNHHRSNGKQSSLFLWETDWDLEEGSWGISRLQFCTRSVCDFGLSQNLPAIHAIQRLSAKPKFICGLRAGWNLFREYLGKRELLGASEWPTLFSRSVENGQTSPRPLGRGFQEPELLKRGVQFQCP